jgi:hypothetical protein
LVLIVRELPCGHWKPQHCQSNALLLLLLLV